MNKRKTWLLVLLIFVLCGGIGFPFGASAATGRWVTQGNLRYYYVNEVPVSGWQKISKKWYYFDPSTHVMQKNKIVGSGKSGYYYVDETGVRITDPVVKLAVKCVRKNAKKAKTPAKKLKACYSYFVNKCKYRHYANSESISDMPSFAKSMFKKRYGDCYRGAAAITYCAKVLGFETRMGMGGVYYYEAAHGWNEVKTKKGWAITDISRGRASGKTLCMKIYAKYPYHLRIDKYYRLSIKNGKVKWTKKRAGKEIH